MKYYQTQIWLNDLLGRGVWKCKYILLNPLSPPHLCLHLPRHSPDCSAVRLCLFRLPVPPRGHWSCCGQSVPSGGAVFCGPQDWRIGRLQSLLWSIQDPNRDGIPVYDGPRSQSAGMESREPRCPALSGTEPFSGERERREHCGGLKQNEMKSY